MYNYLLIFGLTVPLMSWMYWPRVCTDINGSQTLNSRDVTEPLTVVAFRSVLLIIGLTIYCKKWTTVMLGAGGPAFKMLLVQFFGFRPNSHKTNDELMNFHQPKPTLCLVLLDSMLSF